MSCGYGEPPVGPSCEYSATGANTGLTHVDSLLYITPCPCVSFFLAPLPNSQPFSVVFESWLFSAAANSSSACSLIPTILSLAGWLPFGLAFKSWSSHCLPSLPSQHWWCRHTCSLLLSVTAQPHAAVMVLSPPLSPSSWAQNTLHNLPRGLISGHSHLGSGRLQSRKSTGSGVRHDFTPVLVTSCLQNRPRAAVRIHGDNLCEVSAQSA